MRAEIAVSEEERNFDIPDPEAEITTEEPVAPPEPPKRWQMPEPVFRQTSGYLPQGFEKRYPARTENNTAPAPPPAPDPFAQTFVGTPGMSPESFSRPAPEPAAGEIEEQPEVIEEPVPEAAEEPVSPKKERSRAARIFLAVLMVLAAIAFVIVFLGVVYFLFLKPEDGFNPFN